MWGQCPCGALIWDQVAHARFHETYPIPPDLTETEETQEAPGA